MIAGLCYATVGVHPCSANTFESYEHGPTALLAALRELALKAKAAGTATAFGEVGLDYDRLHYAEKETQLKYFRAQLDIAVELQMPLFLHSRAAAEDFEALLKERLDELPKRGCVHSFTGTLEEMKRIVDMGFDVGINGCSLKTEENIAVVKEVPLERLQIETDGPWVSCQSHEQIHQIANPNSAICVHHTLRQSISRMPPSCPRRSKRRSGHQRPWSRAGMSPAPSATLHMLLPASREYLSKRSAKRESSQSATPEPM